LNVVGDTLNIPFSGDLKHTINFGSTDFKNGMTLKFKEFIDEEYLAIVWVKVLNLPKALPTYEVLWAIGTMFGATTLGWIRWTLERTTLGDLR
jgi:hypothetical protein